MKATRAVVGVAAAVGLLVGGAASASANIAWCVEDPPVQVQTPTGGNLTVNVGVAVPQGQAKYINSVAIDAVTEPDAASGGTLITVTVTVPSNVSVANVTASVKKYKVSTSATVPSGASTTLYLVVPTT